MAKVKSLEKHDIRTFKSALISKPVFKHTWRLYNHRTDTANIVYASVHNKF